MALSFEAVRKAYEVFNELRAELELKIPAFPDDMSRWPEEERKHPPLNTVIGFDKKYDNGWENLVIFVRNPSNDLKAAFDELKNQVPNSSISGPFNANPELWIFGWF